MEPSNHCWTGVSHTSHTSKGTVCNLLWTAFLSCVPAFWVSPLGAPGIVFQQVGLKLSLFSRSCTAILPLNLYQLVEGLHTGQSRLCFLDQSNCKNLDSSFSWEWTNQGPRSGIFLCIRQLLCGSESTILPFHQRLETDWLPFPGWS